MKKNKLIELLNAIPGNPEIYLWNGYVGDYQNIATVTESDVVKETFEYFSEMVRLRECRDRLDWEYQLPDDEVKALKRYYTSSKEWEFNDYVTLEDIDEKRYKKKRIFLIDAKPRGKHSWDRMGGLSY